MGSENTFSIIHDVLEFVPRAVEAKSALRPKVGHSTLDCGCLKADKTNWLSSPFQPNSPRNCRRGVPIPQGTPERLFHPFSNSEGQPCGAQRLQMAS